MSPHGRCDGDSWILIVMWENDLRWPAAKWPHQSSERSSVKCSVSRQEVLSPGWCWQSPPSPSHRETPTTSERSVASLAPAPILPECWGNIKILKLWFENYFSKGKFIGEVFLSHSASTLLLAVIAWMVFGNKILFAGPVSPVSPVIFIFKVENSWTLAPHHSNDLVQPDLVGSNVCTKQET